MPKDEANINITHHLSEVFNTLFPKENYSKLCVLVDENTELSCLPKVQSFLADAHVIKIKSGEEEKTLATCEKIWNAMTDLQLDRKALLVNLGGGVIGDMGGFCASTYKRGIDFLQMPTTLLSQVDASVGGKLGVDFHSFKNHIGIFRVPNAVLINTDFLETLDPRELRSGYAEVIKHALIADFNKWEELKTKTLSDLNWDDVVEHSVAIKSAIAKEDPTEKGLRKVLNFGHTIGHAVESFYLPQANKKLLHGEAIAVGMIAEAYVSVLRGFITQSECDDIKAYIISIYGHVIIPEVDFKEIVPLTLQDKKNENSTVLCTLLQKVGEANYNNPLSKEDIIVGLQYHNK